VYKKILLINPFGIGDVLFTTPVIHTLKEAFPGVKLGYLCNSRTRAVLESNPCIDYVFVYNRDEFEALRKKTIFAWLKKSVGFLARIKKEHFDLALDFSLNTQFGFLCWFAGIKERIGYDFKGRGRFLTKKTGLSGYSDKHIVEYYSGLLKLLGIELKYKKLELYLREEDIKRAEEILTGAGIAQSDLVGVIPGAGRSWGKDAFLKHWPPDNFAELADKIIENYRVKIIIMGDSTEQEIAQRIKKHMKHEALDLSGMTTTGQLAALLSKMKLVITNDGGPLHMAVALGIKTISIFGPVDERVYGPYPPSQDHIVIKSDVSCRPCYRNFRMPFCRGNRECIENINTEDVFGAIRRIL
jgi:lipopolysaccharide heptosyltransferase II